jgi:3-hydroxyacyl-[acyl-carrier-protein] dehydratase
MKFVLIDSILERTDDRIVAVKQVSLAEEYLADHFPGFAVLPGVLMLEAMVQAGRELLADRSPERLVLGEVKAMKYGNMVRPGERLIVEVTLSKGDAESGFTCKGIGRVQRDGEPSGDSDTAVSGRFVLRPVRLG